MVHLTERRPIAIWQNKGEQHLIDETGKVIMAPDLTPFASLVVAVGEDAPQTAPSLIAMLNSQPDLKQRISAAIRVSGRRWDLKLNNGLVIKLPEENPELAFEKLANLQDSSKILDKDLIAIDMRLPDRMYLQMKDKIAPQELPPGPEKTT
jgi:cell division protein FtsQ